MGVIIPTLLSFYVKEFVDLGFQVNKRSPEFVVGQT